MAGTGANGAPPWDALAVGETLSAGVRRIATASIEGAASALRTGADAPDEAVHEARKGLKRARALVRLARAGPGESRVRDEQGLLRDLGRELAAARDRRVLGDTLRGLAPDVDEAAIRGRILEVSPPEDGPSSPGARRLADPSMPRLIESLSETAARVSTWPETVPGEAGAREGLRATREAGRRRMVTALEAVARGGVDADPPLHRWRTRVKDLLYQLRLFAPAWPEVLGEEVERLDALADALGAHHDLSLAAAWLEAHEPELARAAAAALADRLSAARQAAVRLGPPSYEGDSGQLADRILARWRRWRDGQEGGAPFP